MTSPQELLQHAACPVGEIGQAVMRPKAESPSTADQPQAVEITHEPQSFELPLLLPAHLPPQNGGVPC
jgi:hypothetical protein